MSTGALFGESPAEGRAVEGKTAMAHCDGGARGNPGPAGYGAVVTDESGRKLAELSEYLGKRTNNFAEYSGLLGVLEWSLEHGVEHLRVVSDSELMVKQVQGRYKVNSPDLRPLFEEARRRIGRLKSFQITHALRHKNKDADRLANEAMDRGMGRVPEKSAAPAAGSRDAAASERTAGCRVAALAAGPGGAAAPGKQGSVQGGAASGGMMLRGFVKDGVVHLLGGKSLPEGSFVKVIAE